MTQNLQPASPNEYDVIVVGGGLAGVAACIFLREKGLSVLCIEPEPYPHARVGESLDWSAPALLKVLGFPRDEWIAAGLATYKKNIKVQPLGSTAWTAQPEPWFRKWPLKWEIATLHVDRALFDQKLFEKARDLGTTFLWDRVTRVDTEGGRVLACQTASGRRLCASWFLDNSGHARLFGNAFGISKVEYGRPKVCLWTYFDCPIRNEGTTFYANTAADEYLTWTWEIPITPSVLSIGCIMPAENVKRQREKGESVQKILADELSRYDPLAPLVAAQPEFKVLACSYRSYVSQSVCGANWFMIGECGSFPDPLTANGVTAAFRHAQESARLIAEASSRGSIPERQQRLYNTRVRRMGHSFNHSIETAIYEWPVRKGLGPLVAQKIYTAFSYPINAIYTRLRPWGRLRTAIMGLILDGVWVWMVGFSLAGRLAFEARRLRQRRLWGPVPAAEGTQHGM